MRWDSQKFADKQSQQGRVDARRGAEMVLSGKVFGGWATSAEA